MRAEWFRLSDCLYHFGNHSVESEVLGRSESGGHRLRLCSAGCPRPPADRKLYCMECLAS